MTHSNTSDPTDPANKAWLEARKALMEREKAHTRERAALAEARRALPRLRITKNYTFQGPTGELPLSDLFGDTSQLLVYHLMFGPGWTKPCIGCAQWANALNGTTDTFAAADATLIAVSRAPFEEMAAQQARLGWTFGWYSSFGSDFNYDFYASNKDTSKGATTDTGLEIVEFDRGENHGVSVFVKDGDAIYHTYSAYNRGIEDLNGAFGYYDLLPKGRAW